MKVLVVGATGFLGAALTKALIEQGNEVRVMVRMTSKLDALEGLPIDVQYGCLESFSCLDHLMDEIEIVYNCAAVSADWGRWQEFYEANVLGVENLAQAAQRARTIQRFVHISNTAVYGYPAQVCDETHPIVDVHLPFNTSKAQGEHILWENARRGLPLTILRPTIIYGPHSPAVIDWANQLIRNEVMWIDGGKTAAGLMYIDNAVEAIIQASLAPAAKGQAYNLRDESREHWREFGVTLASGLNTPVPSLNLPDPLVSVIAAVFEILYRLVRIQARPIVTRQQVYQFSRDQAYPIDKAQKDFGLTSKVSFTEGMQKTIKWLKSPEGKAFLVER
jgi:nucleoside-diphosphate-sugar epimerase